MRIFQAPRSARLTLSIDSPEGRVRQGQRFATVEPAFGNLRYDMGLDRFTLRGKKKADEQFNRRLTSPLKYRHDLPARFGSIQPQVGHCNANYKWLKNSGALCH